MMGIRKSFKIVALAAIMLASSAATSSNVNYRMHYLTESGNCEPGFPCPYVGYSDYYCDGSVVTYGLVTGNQEYEFISNC